MHSAGGASKPIMNQTASMPLPKSPNLVRRGIWVMLVSVAGFTVNALLLKYLGSTREIPSMVPLLFRAVVGIAIVLLFFRGNRPTLIRPVFGEGRLIARGVLGCLSTAAYYWTVPVMGPGKATIFCHTYVVFAAIIAAFLLKEALPWIRVVWLAIAMGGIVLLSGARWGGAECAFGAAEVVALLGAALAAVAVVLIRQLTVVHSIGTIYLAQCVWILLPILPLTVSHLRGLTAQDLALMTLAAVAGGYGQLAMNEGYRCLTVSAGASLQMLWPVATALGGIVWFGERFALLQVLGAVLILAAAWSIAVRREPERGGRLAEALKRADRT